MESWLPLAALAAFMLLAGALAALLVATRGAASAAGQVDRELRSLREIVDHLAVSQEVLQRDVLQAREASLVGIAEVGSGLKDELGAARRTLVELRSAETSRSADMERAARSLARLEAVVAGSSSRGAAGEQLLARSLDQLPPDMLVRNVAFGSRVVEYALVLPDGRYLPIDSKWPAAAELERMASATDEAERQRLRDRIGRTLRGRASELRKYLDPERTLELGLVAVPDAAYEAAPGVVADAYRDGVIVVPYSLTLPFALGLFRLGVRFSRSLDINRSGAALVALDAALLRADEELEGRLSRALVQLSNGRDAIRGHLAELRRALASLDPGRKASRTEGVDPPKVTA
jgi:DNA recombination protein RmuC